MREIKFRAWDKENKIMRYAAMGKTSSEFSPQSGLINLEYMFEWDNIFPIMEYTGLKDKNGKEIYEGDIVKEENETGIFFYAIEWEKYDCCFYPKALNFKTAIELRMSSNYTEFEVIGNIYENPDLKQKISS